MDCEGGFHHIVLKIHFSSFARNYEADASEFLENLEKYFHVTIATNNDMENNRPSLKS